MCRRGKPGDTCASGRQEILHRANAGEAEVLDLAGADVGNKAGMVCLPEKAFRVIGPSSLLAIVRRIGSLGAADGVLEFAELTLTTR